MSYIQTQPVGEYVSTSGNAVTDFFTSIGNAFQSIGSASGGNYVLTHDSAGSPILTPISDAWKSYFETIQLSLNALGAGLVTDGKIGTKTLEKLREYSGAVGFESEDAYAKDVGNNPGKYVTLVAAAVRESSTAMASVSGRQAVERADRLQSTGMLATITQSALFIPGLAALAVLVYLNRKALGFKGGKGKKSKGKKKGRR